MSRRSRKQLLIDLETKVDVLRSELSAAEADTTERFRTFETVIDGHDATLDQQSQAIASLPKADTVAAKSDLEALAGMQAELIDELRAAVARQQGVIDALRARLDQLEATTAARDTRIEARLTEVSEQFVRQFDELAGGVDESARLAEQALAAQQALDARLPEEVVDHLRTSQTKLANEQVRYDLALRAELAELAERLRRSGRG